MEHERTPAGLPVPPRYQEWAEEVRAHLCLLRGGAPFLSPMDAWQLVTWFDAGVRVADILLALERAAEARRANRSRFPLTLGAAKRHLGKPPRGRPVRTPAPEEAPFGPLLDGVEAAEPLHAALVGLAPGEDGELRALAAIRLFLEDRWAALGEAGRREYLDRARVELEDLLRAVDEETGDALVEETARDLFRQRWPRLSAAAVRDLYGPRS